MTLHSSSASNSVGAADDLGKLTNDINIDSEDNKSSSSSSSSNQLSIDSSRQHDTANGRKLVHDSHNHQSETDSLSIVDRSALDGLSKSHASWSAQQQKEESYRSMRPSQVDSYFRRAIGNGGITNQMEPRSLSSTRSMSLGRGEQQQFSKFRAGSAIKRRPYQQLDTQQVIGLDRGSDLIANTSMSSQHSTSQRLMDAVQNDVDRREDGADNGPKHQPLKAARRLLAHELNNDDLYSPANEYQHYAPGSYQHWRMQSSLRPTQYATLARTNHVEHESSSLNNYNMSSRLDRFKYSSNHNFNHNNSNGKLLSRTSANRDNNDLLNTEYDLPDSTSRSYIHSHRPMAYRRPGRYNTLTNVSSSRDHWHSQDVSSRWRQVPTGNVSIPNDGTALVNWLLPGSPMILPRIDSSTLRRKTRLQEPGPSTSIAEESISDDREDLAH